MARSGRLAQDLYFYFQGGADTSCCPGYKNECFLDNVFLSPNSSRVKLSSSIKNMSHTSPEENSLDVPRIVLEGKHHIHARPCNYTSLLGNPRSVAQPSAVDMLCLLLFLLSLTQGFCAALRAASALGSSYSLRVVLGI